jgi:hypothetical protein
MAASSGARLLFGNSARRGLSENANWVTCAADDWQSPAEKPSDQIIDLAA